MMIGGIDSVLGISLFTMLAQSKSVFEKNTLKQANNYIEIIDIMNYQNSLV